MLMEYVKVFRPDERDAPVVLDPEPYLVELPRLAARLPSGAHAFATEPGHYDFASLRCVKDLQFGTLLTKESGGAQIDITLALRGSKFKHSDDLVLRYANVVQIRVEVTPLTENARVWPASRRLGDLQLDEILPTDFGCSHELKLTGGVIFVECADLTAEWSAFDPTER